MTRKTEAEAARFVVGNNGRRPDLFAGPYLLPRRQFLAKAALTAGWAILHPYGGHAAAESKPTTDWAATDSGGEVLYNGIRLPKVWPPRNPTLTLDLPLPPYLVSPPAVIPIDVGRQLFVDDFLIEHSTLQRSFHAATYHPACPVLRPDKPWEQERGPTAMIFSDGVWFDAKDSRFKMWYMSGYVGQTAYAVSQDGLRWEKPELDVQPGTNIVHATRRDSSTVWLDREDPDPSRRYKLFLFAHPVGSGALSLYFSPDGIHWSDQAARSGPTGDRTTIFYNSFRKVWVYSLRGDYGNLGRVRNYREHRDVLEGAKWKAGEPVLWVGADNLDFRRADLNQQPELYNLDAVAYESVLLGLFSIWRGQPKDRAKPNEICLGFSRDGFHWVRPEHRAFIPVSEEFGTWNWGNVQSAGGGCLVVRDKLFFYVSGRSGVRGSPASGVSSTGLALLRRDGFASMAAGELEGTLTTRPVSFGGRYLFVNVDALAGELRVEVLGQNGKVIAPFSRANCIPLHGDKTLHAIQWTHAKNLAALSRRPVKFRFWLRQGRIYAFWVSPDQTGASHGYVAAGGPGFTCATDTVGSSVETGLSAL